MSFSMRQGLTLMVIAVAWGLPSAGVLAQERNDQGWDFIPAEDEQCGVACPNPDAPLSRVNYPPRDDNFDEMFLPTESGLRIVPNPHWNGTEATGAWCGVNCANPYEPAGLDNPLRRNDATELMLVFVSHGNDVYVRATPNPSWVGRENRSGPEAVDAMDTISFSPPLPLLGLAASNGEAEISPEPTSNRIVSRSIDRSGVSYHAAGDDVFQPEVLRSIGGVLSQGSASRIGPDDAPVVQFAFGKDARYAGFIFVSSGVMTGRYHIRYEDLVPMALFVDSGGTSLYTLWEANRLPENFGRDAGFARHEGGAGHVAIEFAGTWYADALYFLDTCLGCLMPTDDNSKPAVDASALVDTESHGERSSSYINSDVGSVFEVEKAKRGRVTVHGEISRFYWSTDRSTSGRVSMDERRRIVRPDALRSNVESLLKEAFQSENLEEGQRLALLLMRIRVREEGGIVGRRRLADAFFLFETLALLRATKLHAPKDWSTFMAAISSDWLVGRNREPWKRYTEVFCGVYAEAPECNGINRAQ